MRKHDWRAGRQDRAGTQRGFSLIEIIVVIGIAAILVGLATPGFQVMMDNQRLNTSANNLYSAINMTRSEAIARGARVDLIPTDGTDWKNGWVTLIDLNNNQTLDANEKGLYFYDALPPGMTVTATFTKDTAKYLAFNGAGRSRDKTSSQLMREATFLLTLHGKKRKVVVSKIGPARVCNPDLDAGC